MQVARRGPDMQWLFKVLGRSKAMVIWQIARLKSLWRHPNLPTIPQPKMPSVSLCRPRGGLRRVPAAILLAACAAGVKLLADAPMDTAPTWAHDVAPILMENCVECHRPDNVAPFPLLSYRDAAKRARFLAKTVTSRIMPPWSPAGPVGAFLGERRLTDEQIATIEHWAETGAASGDMTQAPAVPPARADGWHLGPPDVVVRMRRPFAIPAGPEDAYEVFPVP